MSNSSLFSTTAWQRNLALYEAILDLPFNRELEEGSLSEERFKHYMIQDAHYLEGFARALALAAARGRSADDVVHFAEAAKTAIVVERSLHADFFKLFGVSEEDFASTRVSPACEHYVSWLLRVTALESEATGLAALLPCFWIYREVGKHIHARAAKGNRYQAWIDTYSGEEFARAVDEVISVVDEVAEEASEKERKAMHNAFTRATELEWLFWDSAYRLECWPTGPWVAAD